MKTFSLKTLSVVLILAAHLFAQRFVAEPPDSFETGYSTNNGSKKYGFLPYTQSVALGKKNSSYSNLMLLNGLSGENFKVVDSHGAEYGDIVLRYTNDRLGGIAVLDSFSDNKKSAVVAFVNLKKIIVAELKLNNSNSVEYSILSTLEMQEPANQGASESNAGYYRRMTLMGTEQRDSDKIYHIAVSHPRYKSGNYNASGRVDFFSIQENKWLFIQPNPKGIESGSGMLFTENTNFGSDLVAIDDLDGNGYNELAVLAPNSEQFPNGAVYIFFMDSPYAPSSRSPVILTGTNAPWIDNEYKDYPRQCKYMSFAKWQNESHLLLSCAINTYISTSYSTKMTIIKDFTLDKNANIATTNIFSRKELIIRGSESADVYSNAVPIKNHKNGKFALVQPISEPCNMCSRGALYIYNIADVDASKNFSIEVGREEAIINIDSLFYKSGTVGYSSKTITGLAQCNVNNANKLVCEAGEDASGSWSSIELSSKSACSPYKACKRKDTVHVYARTNSEPANIALRIPKDIIIPWQSSSFALNDLNSLTYFNNPGDLNTDISFDSGKLKSSAIFNNSIIPFAQREGIDTLTFNLSIGTTTNRYPVRLHITDEEKIQKGEMQDTIWNTAEKKYIELPLLNANGNSYTYDISQDDLNSYAEIAGNYLHILKVDFAEISIAYTEEGQIKKRNLVLMPEPKPVPKEELDGKDKRGDSKTSILSAIELNEEFDFIAYNLKGVEVQRGKAYSISSLSKILKKKGPQVARIKTNGGKIFYITIYGNI